MDRRQFLMGAAAASALPAPALALVEDDKIIRLRDLYDKGMTFSDLARRLEGDRIGIRGFMAPPLKAESTFFVLTKMPMSVCPFCETSADWPDDILAIYTKRIIDVVPYNVRIFTEGTLSLGEYRDPETGFLSRVRLEDAVYRRG